MPARSSSVSAAEVGLETTWPPYQTRDFCGASHLTYAAK
jgi:hypothetical protein